MEETGFVDILITPIFVEIVRLLGDRELFAEMLDILAVRHI